MPVDSFRFVSPGVFINEIDQSQVVGPAGPGGSGPVVFGVSEKGPALVPTKVRSFSEFVDLFGQPLPGSDANGDQWREGNYSNPTYGAYAAQAYLANGSPLTFVRLVGDQDPAATTKAGWKIPRLESTSGIQTSKGATYGLFIVGTGSTKGEHRGDRTGEGMLAAIFQLTGSDTTVELVGPLGRVDNPEDLTAAGAMIGPKTVDSKGEFRVRISGSHEVFETTFNFDPANGRYIRKVFNTNPHLLNGDITPTANRKDYFLAESYERAVVDTIQNLDNGSVTRTDMKGTLGVILGLSSGSAASGGDFEQAYATPATPWIIGQDLNTVVSIFDLNSDRVQTLFRVHSREGVEYAQRNYKISFSDIKQSSNPLYQPYGTFTLMVRDIKDTDENPKILEQFNNLDLNPASNNFIGKRIGDRSFTYDAVNSKWTETGQYPVQSKLIRVELDPLVENGNQDAALLPFGFRGIPIYRGGQIRSGSTTALGYSIAGPGISVVDMGPNASIIQSGCSGSIPADAMPSGSTIITSTAAVDFGFTLGPGHHGGGDADCLILTASLAFPPLPQRSGSSDGRLAKETNAFFGLSTNQSITTQIFDGAVRDLVRMKPTNTAKGNVILSPGFSLDDLVKNAGGAFHLGSDIFVYSNVLSGSGSPLASALTADVIRGTPGAASGRRSGRSMTAASASYTEVLDQGFNKFTVPLYGGFDGFDITEKNPFNNTRALDNSNDSKTTAAYPMFYTVKKAIDSVIDVDQVDINMAAIPGVTDSQSTDLLLQMAEDRKDTLAIIDLEGGYTPSTENTDSFSDRIGSSATTVTNINSRNLNNSYGCAYYPWVQINDTLSQRRLWVPPSTIALGVMASSAATAELWFAPAGFNRGGLNNGSAGLNVVNVVEKLTADQRDDLYEVNINPIASFPAEGIVVFGQKTLQATSSALDRINVRRLMIFLKKQITEISNGILFDPNQQVTWNRFLNQVNPFLASVRNRFGLSDYKVVLDASTTTPDLVDRNVMYAKILLKPTRAIEFIALDFVITRSGVEFE